MRFIDSPIFIILIIPIVLTGAALLRSEEVKKLPETDRLKLELISTKQLLLALKWQRAQDDALRPCSVQFNAAKDTVGMQNEFKVNTEDYNATYNSSMKDLGLTPAEWELDLKTGILKAKVK